jgi:hypothetical protein
MLLFLLSLPPPHPPPAFGYCRAAPRPATPAADSEWLVVAAAAAVADAAASADADADAGLFASDASMLDESFDLALSARGGRARGGRARGGAARAAEVAAMVHGQRRRRR